MASKGVSNAAIGGLLLAFVGGVYGYTMAAVGKNDVDEARTRSPAGICANV